MNHITDGAPNQGEAQAYREGIFRDAVGDDALPEGHPIPWEQLVPYEQEQCGYWLYGPHCDAYGNGKIWVSVPRPQGEKG